MSESKDAAAIAEFLRHKRVTRCPTACAVPTCVDVTEADRAALRDYAAEREAARLERARNYLRLGA